MCHRLYRHFIRLPKLFRIFAMAITVVIFFGVMIHYVEPEKFTSVYEGVWWAIITSSGVGYGDYYPETIPGRITAVFLIFIGVGFLSSYFISLATATVSKQNMYLEGKAQFRGDRHLIIIGWNERSREIIQAFRALDKETEIVLIDGSLDSNPMNDSYVDFIKGRPFEESILLKANIKTAKKVLITADQHKSELESDMNTILTLLTVKGLNPDITAIVEVLTRDQIPNAKRAGADEIIQSNRMMSYIMTNSIAIDGIAPAFIHILDQLNGTNFCFHPSNRFVSESFYQTNGELLKEGKLLIGIKRGEDTMVNPPQETVIEENDQLLILGRLNP